MAKNVKKHGSATAKNIQPKQQKKSEHLIQKDNKPKEKMPSFKYSLFHDFSFSFKNKKFLTLLPFFLVLIIFLLIWKEPEVESVDPWYAAYKLVDSALKISDPALKQKLLDEGGSQLKQLVKKYPFHAKVHLLTGVYFSIIHEWDSAIYHQKETIRLGEGGTINPVDQDGARQLLIAISNKANQLINEKNDLVLARRTVDDGLVYIKNSPDLLAMLGVIKQRQGNADSAVIFYEKALSFNPDLEFARNNYSFLTLQLGNIEFSKGSNDKALHYYLKSISLNSKNPDAFCNIGAIYTKMKKYSDAIKSFKEALDLQPDNKYAINGIINAYNLSGDIKSAEQYKAKLR